MIFSLKSPNRSLFLSFIVETKLLHLSLQGCVVNEEFLGCLDTVPIIVKQDKALKDSYQLLCSFFYLSAPDQVVGDHISFLAPEPIVMFPVIGMVMSNPPLKMM